MNNLVQKAKDLLALCSPASPSIAPQEESDPLFLIFVSRDQPSSSPLTEKTEIASRYEEWMGKYLLRKMKHKSAVPLSDTCHLSLSWKGKKPVLNTLYVVEGVAYPQDEDSTTGGGGVRVLTPPLWFVACLEESARPDMANTSRMGLLHIHAEGEEEGCSIAGEGEGGCGRGYSSLYGYFDFVMRNNWEEKVMVGGEGGGGGEGVVVRDTPEMLWLPIPFRKGFDNYEFLGKSRGMPQNVMVMEEQSIFPNLAGLYFPASQRPFLCFFRGRSASKKSQDFVSTLQREALRGKGVVCGWHLFEGEKSRFFSSREEYEMKSAAFTLFPRLEDESGGESGVRGIEDERIWEAITYGSIPVIEKAKNEERKTKEGRKRKDGSIQLDYLGDHPLLLIDSWEEFLGADILQYVANKESLLDPLQETIVGWWKRFSWDLQQDVGELVR